MLKSKTFDVSHPKRCTRIVLLDDAIKNYLKLEFSREPGIPEIDDNKLIMDGKFVCNVRTTFSVYSEAIYMVIHLPNGVCFRKGKNGWDSYREQV